MPGVYSTCLTAGSSPRTACTLFPIPSLARWTDNVKTADILDFLLLTQVLAAIIISSCLRAAIRPLSVSLFTSGLGGMGIVDEWYFPSIEGSRVRGAHVSSLSQGVLNALYPSIHNTVVDGHADSTAALETSAVYHRHSEG